jgi:hypothetical protein
MSTRIYAAGSVPAYLNPVVVSLNSVQFVVSISGTTMLF